MIDRHNRIYNICLSIYLYVTEVISLNLVKGLIYMFSDCNGKLCTIAKVLFVFNHWPKTLTLSKSEDRELKKKGGGYHLV